MFYSEASIITSTPLRIFYTLFHIISIISKMHQIPYHLSIKGYESNSYICQEIYAHKLYTNIVLTLANKVTTLLFTS